MRRIFLNKKTGFDIVNKNKPVIIRDSRGKLFYSTESLVPDVSKFNLPAGINFFVDSGHFKVSKNPVRYKKIRLKKNDRNIKKNPENFRIVFNANPNQVTVLWDENAIVFDNSFKDKSLPELYYALFHECGHRFWDKGETAERNCDEFAYNKMIEMGFNPTQAESGINGALKSHASLGRKNSLINKIIENER